MGATAGRPRPCRPAAGRNLAARAVRAEKSGAARATVFRRRAAMRGAGRARARRWTRALRAWVDRCVDCTILSYNTVQQLGSWTATDRPHACDAKNGHRQMHPDCASRGWGRRKLANKMRPDQGVTRFRGTRALGRGPSRKSLLVAPRPSRPRGQVQLVGRFAACSRESARVARQTCFPAHYPCKYPPPGSDWPKK